MIRSKRNRFFFSAVFALLLITACTAFAFGVSDNKLSPTDYTKADVVLLLTYVLLALVFSFICSVAEAVLLSITPSYIAGLREKKPKLAALLKRLKQKNIDHSLAAILTLNTIAHTVGAIGSGAKATVIFGSAWFGLFSAIMTLMILFLSEIIPKTLGAVYWRNLTWAIAHFIRGLIVVLYPLIVVSEGLTKLIKRSKDVHIFSRDEFIAMAGIGEKAGQIQEHESRIIRNLFRLSTLKAKDIMTPRTVILGLQEDTTVADALDSNAYSSFSRIPLYRKDLDDITGFLLKSDILLYKAQGRDDTRLE
ncbi:CNNM domain-containing protein, partial [Thermodesulfobacteriota bacterium]